MTFQRLSLSLVNNRKPLTAVFLPLVRFSAHVFLLACLRAAKLAGSKSVAKKFEAVAAIFKVILISLFIEDWVFEGPHIATTPILRIHAPFPKGKLKCFF